MSDHEHYELSESRYFSADPRQNALAGYLFNRVSRLPLICPHGHVDPAILADPDYTFPSPIDLLLKPDHYLFRMLYSQCVRLEQLGISSKDGRPVEKDPRKIWQLFADHYYLFRGTPSGGWLNHELYSVFKIKHKLNAKNAQEIYDQIAACLTRPEFRPRKLFEQFDIEVLCTTDSATDRLEAHAAIKNSGWKGRVLPTFRPDALLDLRSPGWKNEIDALSAVSGIDVVDFASFLQAVRQRREFFKSMGAVCSDHGVTTPYTYLLSSFEAQKIFSKALMGQVDGEEARQFSGFMLIAMAEMSIEDGLVMQLHAGAFRDYNPEIFSTFGKDKGADIPIQCEFTQNLKPLLDRVGNDPRLTLILFTLDEDAYSRELAPLAGHFPALRLGPPWWFHDSPNGMLRYLDRVAETAGIYNLAGFNDDTRAFLSIPARHDVWRRVSSDWLAGMVMKGRIDLEDAESMIEDLAYNLAKQTYRL